MTPITTLKYNKNDESICKIKLLTQYLDRLQKNNNNQPTTQREEHAKLNNRKTTTMSTQTNPKPRVNDSPGHLHWQRKQIKKNEVKLLRTAQYQRHVTMTPKKKVYKSYKKGLIIPEKKGLTDRPKKGFTYPQFQQLTTLQKT